MAREVISLLSSSPPPVIPAKRPSPQSSKLRTTSSTNRPLSEYTFDDLEEEEALDLTQVNDDIIIPRSSLGGNPTKTSKARSSELIATDPISLLSDDDFDFNDVRQGRKSGDSNELAGPSSKRARLTHPAEHSNRSAAFQNWNFSRFNTAEQSPNGNKSKSDHRSFDLEDDPFASSPPAPREKENRSTSAGAKRITLDDDLEPFASSSPKHGCRQPSALSKRAAEWDPISSSAPQLTREDSMAKNKPRALQRVQSEVIALDDSDDSMSRAASDEDDFPDLAEVDAAKLQRLKAKAASRPPPKPPVKGRITKPKPSSSSRTSAPTSAKTAIEKPWEKEQKAVAREAEKVRKLREKEQQRKDKALAKETAAALAAVNKVRTDKKVSTPEMIVDLPEDLNPTIKVQAETLLKDLDVESKSCNPPAENVVMWRRKVNSRWNEELEHWEPIPPRIDRETYAMVIMPAKQFVQLALATEGVDLDGHVTNVVSKFPNYTVIFLLEGLTPWLRKNRSVRNRAFASAVRSGMGDGVPSNSQPAASQPPTASQQSRRRKKDAQPEQYIDEDMIEDALLQMQVLHNVLIHHTNAPIETAQWIATFTQHISTVPYRRQREETNAASAGFCMENGQVRTGDGPKDTYLRMLQEVGRITAPIAYGIAGEFPTVSNLVRGLERGGPLVLEDVRKSANKDGAFSDRRVGPAVSKRLHKIFTGTDETSTDI